jgi:hypothetical protein
MSAILPYVNNRSVFDPTATHALSVAFEDACRALNVPRTADSAREAIATRIIELAQRGERDPTRLRDRVIREASGTNDNGSGSLK